MALFRVPAQQPRNVLTIRDFLGVDFSNDPTGVDLRRSPNAVNMVRSVPGKVRKSMGYERIDQYGGRINGVFFRRGDAVPLVHVGTRFYKGDDAHTMLYDAAADARSTAFEMGEKLYVADGACLLVYDGETLQPVSDVAYVPIVSIANAPAGGGAQYEALNLLCPKFTERFLPAAATDKRFQLSYAPLDDAPVTAQVLSASGAWVEKKEGADFTVDRATGAVTFVSAPGKSPIEGEDNVSITAARTVAGYAGRINGCHVGALFGVGGAADRLFLSGNRQYVNHDWFSAQNDATYFADLSYGVLGGSGSAVVGYSVVGDKLAAHKDEMEAERNVILREGVLLDGQAAFPIVGTLQGEGAIAPFSFGYLATEPLFLTRLGVYAITPQDMNGEKYAQNRSFYLNGRLLAEENLADAYACVYKDMYLLAINGVCYILDGLQASAPVSGAPYSTRQYAAFYRENLPARVLWQRDGRLYFGSETGGIYRFFADPDAPASYTDDGAAITARWETPEVDGKLFYKNKTFRYLAVRLQSAAATGVKAYVFNKGFWRFLKEDGGRARHLDFAQAIFSKFTFSGDFTPHLITARMRVARTDKARVALVNDAANEPFGLFDVALEYRENGNAR